MTDPCDVCGGKVIEERPDALDGLTVRVCQNEDCALGAGNDMQSSARGMSDEMLTHLLQTTRSALNWARFVDECADVDGGRPADAVDALEDVHDALTNERLSRENEGLP